MKTYILCKQHKYSNRNVKQYNHNKAMKHETHNWNNLDKCEPQQQCHLVTVSYKLRVGGRGLNTLKQEFDGTRAYLETDTDEVVNAHLNDLPVKFSVCVHEGKHKLP